MNKIFKLLWLNLAVVPALFACFIGGLFLSEWVRIGIIADFKIIGNYFGGKAMVVHESWRYASASTYAWTSLVEGIFLLALGTFTFVASIKSKGRNTAIGCLIIFICFLIVSAA
jgi:hypothetical protein